MWKFFVWPVIILSYTLYTRYSYDPIQHAGVIGIDLVGQLALEIIVIISLLIYTIFSVCYGIFSFVQKRNASMLIVLGAGVSSLVVPFSLLWFGIGSLWIPLVSFADVVYKSWFWKLLY